MKFYYDLNELINKCGLPLFVQRKDMDNSEFLAIFTRNNAGFTACGRTINCSAYNSHVCANYTSPTEIDVEERVTIYHGFDMPPEYQVMLSQFNELGFNPLCFGKDGYDITGYDAYGYNRDGLDNEGRDREGYDKDGYDRRGYDRCGYDRCGYDIEGYNLNGIDKCGYDRNGYDSYGFNRDGFDKHGYNEDGLSIDFITSIENDDDNSYDTIQYYLYEWKYCEDPVEYAEWEEDQRAAKEYWKQKDYEEWQEVFDMRAHYDYTRIAYGYDEEIDEYGMPLYENDPYEDGPLNDEEIVSLFDCEPPGHGHEEYPYEECPPELEEEYNYDPFDGNQIAYEDDDSCTDRPPPPVDADDPFYSMI